MNTPTELNQLFDAVGVGLWEYDHVRDRLFYGDLIRTWLGGDFPAPEGSSLSEWLARIHPKDRALAEAAMRSSGERGQPFQIEYRFARADGEWLWLSALGHVSERDVDGKPLRSLGTKSDISARKLQEELFQLQQTFDRVLLDNPGHDALVAAMLDAVLGLSQLDGGGLYEMRRDGGYHLAASRGLSETFLARAMEIEPESFRADLLHAGHSVCSCVEPSQVCSNVDLVRSPHIQAEGITALLVLPIVLGGRVCASLNLASKHVRTLNEIVVRYLESIARQFGQALERLQARTEAQQQRQNLEGFFQAINDFVFVLDVDGRVLHFNSAVKIRLGYDEQLIGCSVLSVHPPRVHDEAMRVIGEMLAGTRVSCPLPLLHANGSEIPVDTRIVQGTWNGQPALLGISRDISELRAAQEALARRERHLRAVLDNFPFLVWLKDSEGRLLEVNQPFAHACGVENAGELVGKTDFDIWPRDLAERYRADDREVLSCGKGKNVEEPIERREQISWIETFKSPVTLDGQVIGTVGYARDITDRIEARKALEHERSFLKTLIQTIPDLIWLKDPNGNYLACNPRFEQFFGAREAEIIGKNDYDFVTRELADSFRSNDRAAIEAGHPMSNEEQLEFADGSPGGLFETSKTPMYAADGQLVGVLGISHDITAARATETALRERQLVLDAIFNQTRAAIDLVDTETLRFVEFNDSEHRMLGYSREEFAALRLHDIQAEMQDEVAVRARIARLRTQGAAVFESRHRRRDGSPIDVHLNLSFTTLHGREMIVAVWDDISERKAAEQALRASELRFHTLFDGMIEGVALHQLLFDEAGQALDYRVVEVNRAYESILGLSRDQVLGRSGREIYGVETAPYLSEFTQVALGCQPMQFETYFAPMDKYFSISVVPWGERGFATIFSDDSLARKAREALAESEERYRILADYSPEWQYWLGPDGHFLYVSPGCEAVSGYKAEAFMSNPGLMREILVDADRSRWDDHVHEVSNHTHDHPHVIEEFCIVHQGGELRWIEHQCLSVNSRSEQYRGRRGVNRDVTLRKAIEQELLKHREHLEALVAQRTSELVAARMRAEEANRAKSSFLANMSHEIRTPMNAIIGLTHVLRRSASQPRQADQLDKVAEAAQHLLGIINDILDISKIEAGKMQLEVADFRLDQVIERTLDLVRGKAAAKGIGLACEIDPALPLTLRGDAQKLGQVLLNFIGNAVKFTEQGDVLLKIALAGPSLDPLNVRFEVSDSGIGMSVEQVSRLFQAFEQADSSITRKYGGTGLGLAINKRLIALMGSEEDIGVESQPGSGSRFWFRVPLELAKSQIRIAPPTDVQAALGKHRGARVLLAEDNAVNQEVALELLGEIGAHVDVAADGVEALRLFGEHHYDLVLMDVQMPLLDGLAATRAIRVSEGTSRTPILAMTANAFEEDRALCLDAGMDDHLTKPVEPAAFFATLAKWLPHRLPDETGRDPENPVEASAIPDLEQIPGLDVGVGLKGVRGKWSSYLRLLRLYAQTHQGDMARLRELHAAGVGEDALRIAHSLKGAAGALGAVKVQSLSAELERALRAGALPAEVESLVARVETEQAGMVTALLRLLPSSEPHPAVVSDEALKRLQRLLHADDMRAGDALRAAHTTLADLLNPEALPRLIHQVESYDFPAALKTLSATENRR